MVVQQYNANSNRQASVGIITGPGINLSGSFSYTTFIPRPQRNQRCTAHVRSMIRVFRTITPVLIPCDCFVQENATESVQGLTSRQWYNYTAILSTGGGFRARKLNRLRYLHYQTMEVSHE